MQLNKITNGKAIRIMTICCRHCGNKGKSSSFYKHLMVFEKKKFVKNNTTNYSIMHKIYI